MNRTWLIRGILSATLAVGGWGCEDDEGPQPDGGASDARDGGGSETTTADGATGGGDAPAADSGAGETGDGGGDGGGPSAAQARGKYLVDVVLGCGDCHTPRGAGGVPDMTKYLAGVSCLFDIMPMAPAAGCVSSKNLTNHETGLKNVTDDAAVKDMFLNGKRPDGKFLLSFMPYYEYHNLSTADADAIVAYLRTVPGVDNRPTANEPPLSMPPPAAAAFVDPATVPMGTPAADAATTASAQRGRYLAMVSCIGCHTPEKMMAMPAELPIDATKFFAGGRAFPAAAFGLPTPPFPQVIYTQNLTQHATGIMGWTADDVVKALKMGKDKMDKGICPPMPAGPRGSFANLTDADARDIANYIVSLPGVMNMLPNQCEVPAMP